MATTFSDMREAAEYIESVLGDFASQYDAFEIAQACTDWVDGKLTLVDNDQLWACIICADVKDGE